MVRLLEGSEEPVERPFVVCGTEVAGTPRKAAVKRPEHSWRKINRIRVAYADHKKEVEEEFPLRSPFALCRDMDDILRVMDLRSADL